MRMLEGSTASSGSRATAVVISTRSADSLSQGTVSNVVSGGRAPHRRARRQSPLPPDSECALIPASAAYSFAVSPLSRQRPTRFAHAPRDTRSSISASAMETYVSRATTSGTRLVERIPSVACRRGRAVSCHAGLQGHVGRLRAGVFALACSYARRVAARTIRAARVVENAVRGVQIGNELLRAVRLDACRARVRKAAGALGQAVLLNACVARREVGESLRVGRGTVESAIPGQRGRPRIVHTSVVRHTVVTVVQARGEGDTFGIIETRRLGVTARVVLACVARRRILRLGALLSEDRTVPRRQCVCVTRVG